jgi:hypothetical protein
MRRTTGLLDPRTWLHTAELASLDLLVGLIASPEGALDLRYQSNIIMIAMFWTRELQQMRASSQGKWYWRLDYLGYVLASALAWAVIWILVGTLASAGTVHALGLVFLGWVIGWGSATIARAVYPAPGRTLIVRPGRD